MVEIDNEKDFPIGTGFWNPKLENQNNHDSKRKYTIGDSKPHNVFSEGAHGGAIIGI